MADVVWTLGNASDCKYKKDMRIIVDEAVREAFTRTKA